MTLQDGNSYNVIEPQDITMKLQAAVEYLHNKGIKVSEGTVTSNAVYHAFIYRGRPYYIYQQAGSTMAVIGIPSINTERPVSVTTDIDSAIGS